MEALPEGQALYYTNESRNNPIIIKIKNSTETPKYIDPENFIFDEELYEDLRNDDSGGYWKWQREKRKRENPWYWWYDEVVNNIELRKVEELWGNKEVTEFIEKKMSEKINEDKSYRNISNNLYAGNYIGFKDSSQMEKFDKLDFYTIYFTLFPNTAAVAFAYIVLFIYLILIVSTIYGLFKKEQEENFLTSRMVISLFTLIIFIGYFSYTLYENGNIYGDMQIAELTNIKADHF